MMNNYWPLITVIIPIYNGAAYISECIDSVIAQSYKNLEIILVDDGSKDNSYDIMTEYELKDNRIKILRQRNKGVSAARNHALRNTHGEYVAFVDQDDCIASDYILFLYNILVKTKAEIALCMQAKRFTMNNIPKEEEKNLWTDKIEVISGEEAAIRMLYYKIIIGPWNKLIRFELIKKYEIWFNEDFFGGEGFAFSVECMQRAQCVAVSYKELYFYRIDNPNSGTTKFSLKMIESSISAQEYIRKNLVNPTAELVKACEYARWHTYCDCFNMIIGCEVKFQDKKLYEHIKYVCKMEAAGKWKSPVALKEKFKIIIFGLSPEVAASIINKMRRRRFTISRE